MHGSHKLAPQSLYDVRIMCTRAPRLRTAQVGLIREHAEAVVALLVAAAHLIAQAAQAPVPSAHRGHATHARASARAARPAATARATTAHGAERSVLLITGEALEVALPLRVAHLQAVRRCGNRARGAARRRAAIRRRLSDARAGAELLVRGAGSALTLQRARCAARFTGDASGRCGRAAGARRRSCGTAGRVTRSTSGRRRLRATVRRRRRSARSAVARGFASRRGRHRRGIAPVAGVRDAAGERVGVYRLGRRTRHDNEDGKLGDAGGRLHRDEV